jgi:multidrug transporter EmrE-like cation transporter
MTAAWSWLAVALLATAIGQLVYKHASLHRSRRGTIAAAGIFCVAPVAAFLALRQLSIATVYVSTALSQIIVVVMSLKVFHEKYSGQQWAGLVLILVGVVIFNSGAFS